MDINKEIKKVREKIEEINAIENHLDKMNDRYLVQQNKIEELNDLLDE